jgi:hypothetical protein
LPLSGWLSTICATPSEIVHSKLMVGVAKPILSSRLSDLRS